MQAQEKKSPFGNSARFGTIQMFAAALVYALPLVQCIQMAADPLTSQWLGYWSLFGLLVIPIMLVVAIRQRSKANAARKGAYDPEKPEAKDEPMMMMLGCLPCAIFFLIGAVVTYRCTRFSDQLLLSDCGQLDLAVPLETTLKEAITFHSKCIADDPGLTEDDIVLIQSCPTYETFLTANETRQTNLGVLRKMEEDYYCAGFCGTETNPLWNFQLYSHKGTLEQCNVPIALRLGSYTRQASIQLMVYSLAALFVFFLHMALAWNFIKDPNFKPKYRAKSPSYAPPYQSQQQPQPQQQQQQQQPAAWQSQQPA